MKLLLKILPVLAILAITATACSNDDEPTTPTYYQLRAADGRTITATTAVTQYATENDFIKMLEGTELVIPSTVRSNSGNQVEARRDTVYGYDSEPYLLNDNWQSVKFGTWCTEYGLESGKTYLLNFKRITKYIPCTYLQQILPYTYQPTDHNMGYRNGVMGFLLDDTGNDAGRYNAYTLIASIDYDSDGNVVNTHYPCEPENLEWVHFIVSSN